MLLFAGQGVLISYLLDSMKVSKRRIAAIVESISDGFAVFDSDWRILMSMSLLHSSHAGLPSQVIGRNLWTCFPKGVGTDSDKDARSHA